MISQKRGPMRRKYGIILIMLLLTLSACLPETVGETTPGPEPAEPEAAAAEDVPEITESEEEDIPVIEEEGPMTLIIWIPGEFDPSIDTVFGGSFIDLLSAYEANTDDLQIEVVRKKITGPGGMFAYLRSAPPVAPEVLPDLVMMDSSNIAQALGEELIVPLEMLSSSLSTGVLYPAAAELAQVDGALVSWPYLLEAQHTVYRQTFFTEAPCLTGVVIKAGVPFEFAAAPLTGVNQTTLHQYLAAGGTLEDEAGNPALDTAILTELLDFYEEGLKEEVIASTIFQYSGPAEVWERYEERLNNLAVVTSTLALSDPEALENTGFCPIPSVAGEPFAFINTWSWAVATADAERQDAALDLLQYMVDPIVQGEFTQSAGWLPSGPAALAAWGEDPYAIFADELLSAATIRPVSSDQDRIDQALQVALEGVLLNELSSVQAATNAAQLLGEETEG